MFHFKLDNNKYNILAAKLFDGSISSVPSTEEFADFMHEIFGCYGVKDCPLFINMVSRTSMDQIDLMGVDVSLENIVAAIFTTIELLNKEFGGEFSFNKDDLDSPVIH